MKILCRILFMLLLTLVYVSVMHVDIASGATFHINTSSDSHDLLPGDGNCGDSDNPDSTCSVRAAIEEANGRLGPDTILIAFSFSPFKLRLGPLTIDDDSLLLRGLGGLPIIDGANNSLGTSNIIVTGNHVTIAGLRLQRSRLHGLLLQGNNNLLGGATLADRLVVVACGIDGTDAAGICISGTGAYGNCVRSTYAGLLADGATPFPNTNAILITKGAHNNAIGGPDENSRNILSGNNGYAVIVREGAHNNVIAGNFIGLDATGTQGPGNSKGGILLAAGAFANTIGGYSNSERNIICGNSGHGIWITDNGSTANRVLGNFIGLEISGIISIGNSGCGILLSDAASGNIIGDRIVSGPNFIAGNYGDGIHISGSGCTGTIIQGNFIGFDTSGYRPFGNGYDFGYGINLGDGVTGTVIGGTASGQGNLVGGNQWGGIFMSGAYKNTIQGNYIGVSIGSVSSAPNGAGVILRHGSAFNQIGGDVAASANVISGNRADVFPYGAGVVLYDPGTEHNTVRGNFIGTDDTGSRALRNGSSGVVIGNGAKYNVIGGPHSPDRNIISGNGTTGPLVSLGAGVHIYGVGTDFNQIIGNIIGTGGDSVTAVTNYGNGVGIFAGAQHNIIGGDSSAAGNLISENALHGVFVDGPSSAFNTIRYNRFSNNGGLSIVLDHQAQGGIEPPKVISVQTGAVVGYDARPGSVVDVYTASADPTGYGEGGLLIASGFAGADGFFSIPVQNLSPVDAITAMITDSAGNSSEFSENVLNDHVTAVNETDSALPTRFVLSQNYPNPFNPKTRIEFSLPTAIQVRVAIYNLLGEEVAMLVDRHLDAGIHQAAWDGYTSQGIPAASGMYLYKMTAGQFSDYKKMLLLR